MNRKQLIFSTLTLAGLAIFALPTTATAQDRVIKRVKTHRVQRTYRTTRPRMVTTERTVVRRPYVTPTRVYRTTYPSYVVPNFGFYTTTTYPQVYRYVRRPRYVWVATENEVRDNNTVYIYQNKPYEVQEREDETPELDCPRNTLMRHTKLESWCATRRGAKHGPYVAYYTNGQVRTEGTYQYGTKDGAWLEYYQEGGIRSEGNYTDGKKVGTWITYDAAGNEATTIFYSDR